MQVGKNLGRRKWNNVGPKSDLGLKIFRSSNSETIFLLWWYSCQINKQDPWVAAYVVCDFWERRKASSPKNAYVLTLCTTQAPFRKTEPRSYFNTEVNTGNWYSKYWRTKMSWKELWGLMGNNCRKWSSYCLQGSGSIRKRGSYQNPEAQRPLELSPRWGDAALLALVPWGHGAM